MNIKPRSIPLFCSIGAEFISHLGNQIAAVTIPILVLQYTHSAIATGIATAGNILPIVLAAFVGGKTIERFGAWRVSIVADGLSGISVLLLPLIFLSFKSVPPIVIFLLVFFGALFDPTATAARQTLIPKFARLAGISLTKVNGYRGSLENGADLLGPILGAVSIGSIGIINTFFANTVSFFICAMVFAIAVPRQHHRVCQSEEKVDPIAGIRFIFQHSQLRSLAVSSMALNFVLLPFLGLLLPILTTQKFASTALLGICLSLFGMAATIGALSFSNLARLIERSTIYYGGLILIAIAIILCGVVETPTGIMFSVTIGGLLLGAGNPLEQTILQEVTPSRIAGQVFTVYTAMSFAVGLIGLPIAGIFTELTNIDLVLIISGSFLAIGSTICWYLMPLSNRRLG